MKGNLRVDSDGEEMDRLSSDVQQVVSRAGEDGELLLAAVRSQCFSVKIGTSVNAQYRWSFMRALKAVKTLVLEWLSCGLGLPVQLDTCHPS